MVSRRAWSAGGTLLLAAGLAAAVVAYVYWLPCRGTMLSGSVLRGYAYGPDFSDACLRRMDSGTPFPFPSAEAALPGWAMGLTLLAHVLAGLAWLVVVLGQPWPEGMRAWMVLPGAIGMALAVVWPGLPAAVQDFAAPLWALPELTGVVVAIVMVAGAPGSRPRTGVLVVVFALGATALGFFHTAFDFLFMMGFSDANWDVPPGTGYLTACLMVAAGVATLVLAPSRTATRADVERDALSASR